MSAKAVALSVEHPADSGIHLLDHSRINGVVCVRRTLAFAFGAPICPLERKLFIFIFVNQLGALAPMGICTARKGR